MFIQVAPIITPAYPAMNSTLSVSRQTLQIMHEEFCRGHEIVSKIWKASLNSKDTNFNSDGEMFSELFQPSDFFISYPRYLSLCIVGPTPVDVQSWAGFVESRLRKLVSDLLGKSLPLVKIQLWPKKFEACVAERDSNLTLAQRKNCLTYFIGFKVDKLRMRGKELTIEQQIFYFKEGDLKRFQPLIPGQDIVFGCHKVKELPRIIFKDNEGGKEAAMKRRRHFLDTDPKRIEAKRLRELKEKEEEVHRKKAFLQEKIALLKAATSNNGNLLNSVDKEVNSDEEYSKVETSSGQEENIVQDEAVDQEESDLLENALDTIQNDEVGAKTREEAAQDRIMLMAGLSEEPSNTQILGKNEERERDKTQSQQDKNLEILRDAGFHVVSDDEITSLGADFVPNWRLPEVIDAEYEKRGMKKRKFEKIRFRFI